MTNQFINFLTNHPWIIFAAAVWTLPWKGVALWRAAQNRSFGWFIVLLIINTLGILEIIYIFYFSREKFPSREFEISERNNFGKRVLDIKRD